MIVDDNWWKFRENHSTIINYHALFGQALKKPGQMVHDSWWYLIVQMILPEFSPTIISYHRPSCAVWPRLNTTGMYAFYWLCFRLDSIMWLDYMKNMFVLATTFSECFIVNIKYSHHVTKKYIEANNLLDESRNFGTCFLSNRPFAAKPSHDLLFIKLCAAIWQAICSKI